MLHKLRQLDENDFPTPQGVFQDIICASRNELNLDIDTMIDVCANSENTKFLRFYSPEENALFQDWHKDGSCGWMAAPFSGKQLSPFECHKGTKQAIQGLFIQKAVEESNHGFITIGLVQSFVNNTYFKHFIERNEFCQEIHMEEKIKYMGKPVGWGRGTSIVIFGVKKGSLSKEFTEYITKIPVNHKATKKPNKNWNINNVDIEPHLVFFGKKKNNILKRVFHKLFGYKRVHYPPIEYNEPFKSEAVEEISYPILVETPNTKTKETKKVDTKTTKRKYIKSGKYTKKALSEKKKGKNQKKAAVSNKLTNRHKKFCWEAIMNGKSWTDAYLMSFETKNRRHAGSNSVRVRKLSYVQKEIKRLKKLKEKENEDFFDVNQNIF
jgi:hypothetical protein